MTAVVVMHRWRGGSGDGPGESRARDRIRRLSGVPGPVWVIAIALCLLIGGSMLYVIDATGDDGVGGSGAARVEDPAGSRHVIAVAGALGGGRAVVTWDRANPEAVAYDVRRDGVHVGTVTVADDPWDDMAFDDAGVPRGVHRYDVRARLADGTATVWSAPAEVHVRDVADVGSGQVFEVDSYPGTDLQRARAAVADADAAGGGVVAFGERRYVLDDTLQVTGDDIVLRGVGAGRTFIEPAFDGSSGDVCGSVRPMLRFEGTLQTLGARAVEPIELEQRSVRVDSTAGLVPGTIVVFDQRNPQSEPGWFAQRGIAQDPGSGNDRRYPWDANEIESVADRMVTFRYPFSQAFTREVEWRQLVAGSGNGIERVTVQGRGPQDTAYQRLVDVEDQAHFTMTDVEGRWANRNVARLGGYDIDVVGLRVPFNGDLGWDTGACKYQMSVIDAANVTFVGAVMGDPSHDRNQDFIVSQRTQRVVIRDSVFHGSRTMAVNEHGGGSRHHVYENNFFSVGAGARLGAIYLGNGRWGFSGPTIIRNNRFEDNYRDLLMLDNPYEVRFVDNRSRGCVEHCVLWSGWGADAGYSPFADANLMGSARLTIARNRFEQVRSVGVHLGHTYSGHYAYSGVKDVVVAGNHFETAQWAVRIFGDATTTRRLEVVGNTGNGRYERPPLTEGSHWEGNPDQVSFGSAATYPWTSESFSWESHDHAT